MYFDKGVGSSSRESWKYNYKGSELLVAARKKYFEFLEGEKAAREIISKLVADIKISTDSREMQQAKADVQHNGQHREACAVYVHEFYRNLDREYNLSIGDVVYFNLFNEEDTIRFAVRS